MILSNEVEVELMGWSGSDAMIAKAARVSTGKDVEEHDVEVDAKLINYLMKNRHGSPFEHNVMNFHISAPIFVFREFMRHRIGWSYNEMSARYREVEPRFWVYPPARPLLQEGSSAHPELVHGHPAMTTMTNGVMEKSYRKAWKAYKELLDDGVAKEVARSVLPVGLFSSMYASCNARSMMAFLSLRVDADNAKFSTKPQWEIEQVAVKMEEEFKKLFPATWTAFDNNGRVAP
jgi:thymidylate synthase (FAD)